MKSQQFRARRHGRYAWHGNFPVKGMVNNAGKLKIQFHTDKIADGSKEETDRHIAQIEAALGRFSEVITHLDVRLSEADDAHTGVNTKKCSLETRLEARKPIAVTNQANTYQKAIAGALDKLTASLDDFG